MLMASLHAAAGAQENPTGTVSYALPQTTISMEVEAAQERFFAGPYAKYAEKYLGIKAEEQDRITYQVTDIKLTPCIEADQSARYTVTLPKSGNVFLQMTAQGLISTNDGGFGKETTWRFPSLNGGGYADKGVSLNLTSESNVLYRKADKDERFGSLSVSQDMMVSKSTEQRAKETAELIVKLRNTRIAIITGDTDADYSGGSLEAAIDEITRLEKEYMSLFIGYSEYQTQKVCFDVVPKDNSRNHIYVAFRLSDTDGLVSADDVSGKPYLLDIVSEGIAAPQSAQKGSAKASIYYRIPAICNVKLTDGANLLLQTRIPIYQFGTTASYPIN